MIKVSAIIPVYGVQSFIGRCARSLMEQTLREDVEFIFVDDAGKDASIEVLKKELAAYPERGNQWKIIGHEQNRGLPAARNTGLSAATGEYVIHIDGDDFVEPAMLEKLLIKAEETDADIVWCDFFISFDKNERYMAARNYASAEELIRKGFFAGDMKYNVWNKLVRRSLYTEHAVSFPEGRSMGEDMTMIMLAAYADKVAYVPEALYHYVKTNAGAMTASLSERQQSDILHNVNRVEEFCKANFPGQYGKDIELFKLNVKLPFLLSGEKSQYALWKKWFPESNAYIWNNHELPFRTKFLEWMAAKGLWTGVKLYYLLVYKFIYGLIYK